MDLLRRKFAQSQTSYNTRCSSTIQASLPARPLRLPYDNGRVVVLGEAAMITVQDSETGTVGFTVPGYDNRQFALNVVRWLTGDLP
jgi:hypothetical protein